MYPAQQHLEGQKPKEPKKKKAIITNQGLYLHVPASLQKT